MVGSLLGVAVDDFVMFDVYGVDCAVLHILLQSELSCCIVSAGILYGVVVVQMGRNPTYEKVVRGVFGEVVYDCLPQFGLRDATGGYVFDGVLVESGGALESVNY